MGAATAAASGDDGADGESGLVNAWVSIPVEDARVDALRRRVISEMGSRYRSESDPHVTVLPQLAVPESQMDRFRRTVRESSPPRVRMRSTGIGAWPSVDEPSVVLLGVEANIAGLRRDAAVALDRLGGRQNASPVPAHITLAKVPEHAEPEPRPWLRAAVEAGMGRFPLVGGRPEVR